MLTFPQDILDDPERYQEAARLPDRSTEVTDDPLVAAAARRRRDLALAGYTRLRARVDAEGARGLADLHAAAGRLVAGRVPEWRAAVRAGAERSAAGAVAAPAELARGGTGHLAQAAVAARTARPGPPRYGMCGRLSAWEL
ncbi:hypothetical protein [Streptomyces sp. NPDC059166]|uniref:hypothetical protein n=1 Tax=Streptomyces sp. NPDC059166 TaxID=3346752 RepID=UPI00369FCFD0